MGLPLTRSIQSIDGALATGITLRFFAPGISEAADQLYAKLMNGGPSGISIGFIGGVKVGNVWTSIQVMECSLVTLPSNPSCTVVEKKLEGESMKKDYGMTHDESAHGKVECFYAHTGCPLKINQTVESCPGPGEGRVCSFNPAGHHGRGANPVEAEGVTPGTGDFFEGEEHTNPRRSGRGGVRKSGRVLSAKNEALIREAHGHLIEAHAHHVDGIKCLKGVLKSAAMDDEDADGDLNPMMDDDDTEDGLPEGVRDEQRAMNPLSSYQSGEHSRGLSIINEKDVAETIGTVLADGIRSEIKSGIDRAIKQARGRVE